jgi:uracil-DNA glycosylase
LLGWQAPGIERMIFLTVNMQDVLADFMASRPGPTRLPVIALEPEKIRAVMINEVVPVDPEDDFYGRNDPPEYMKTTVPLFRKAGVGISSAGDLLNMGIYLTNAIKDPKTGYAVEPAAIEAGVPILSAELDLFPNLKAVMLMGDVAKKAFNIIARQRTGKNAIPSGATYKLRSGEYYVGALRVFPSYIMTGGNILIEKSKVEMASEDIRRMLALLD